MSTTQKELTKKPVKTEETPVLTIAKKDEPEGLDTLGFEDTAHRLNQLWSLHAKYNRFKTSKEKLKQFTFKNDGSEPYSLVIGSGNYRNDDDFTTKNPEIIKEVITFLQALIDRKALEIQNQIRW